MKLKKMAEELGLENLTPGIDLASSPEVAAGYVSDLLSDVLAGAPKDAVLITVQAHLNVIAVAVHAGLSGVIFASGRRPEPGVIEKAVAENIPLFIGKDCSFQIVGKLYSLGLRGPAA
jgi:hypothetical protein